MKTKVMVGYLAALAVGVAGGVLAGRGKLGGRSTAVNASCFTSNAEQEAAPFIDLDGVVTTEDKIPADLQRELAQAQRELYERRSDVANRAALRMILAKEGGKSTDAASIPTLAELMGEGWVKDEDVKKFYDDNKKNLPATMTFEQLGPSLRRHLETQKTMELIRTRIEARRKEGKFRKLFTPPCGRSEALDVAGLPSRGDAAAQNTLVLVSDYGCNLCRSLYFSLESQMEKWDKRLKLVHVPFSGKGDELGNLLVKGAQCAFEKDAKKYWIYNREAYIAPLRAQQIPVARDLVLDVAKRAGFEGDSWAKCLDAGNASQLEKGNAMAKRLGAAESPLLFLNGREVVLMGNDKIVEFIDSF